MGEKYKKIEALMVAEGLTREEVISYLQSKAEVNSSEELSIVNPGFPADDVRSQTKLFWYAFEGKKFSSDPKAYPNCQGVVGWINPDPNAPEGDRVYVVLPEQKQVPYSSNYCYVGAIDLYDGRSNTKKLIDYGKEHHIEFPAFEYAHNYTKNGVKQGEAFGLAREQLRQVCVNRDSIREALKLIGGTFEGWLWSSSEGGKYYAWYVNLNDGGMDCNGKCNSYYSVSCFLAY